MTENKIQRLRIKARPINFKQLVDEYGSEKVGRLMGITDKTARRMYDSDEITAIYERHANSLLREREVEDGARKGGRHRILFVKAEHGPQLEMTIAFLKGMGIKFAQFED